MKTVWRGLKPNIQNRTATGVSLCLTQETGCSVNDEHSGGYLVINLGPGLLSLPPPCLRTLSLAVILAFHRHRDVSFRYLG